MIKFSLIDEKRNETVVITIFNDLSLTIEIYDDTPLTFNTLIYAAIDKLTKKIKKLGGLEQCIET